MAPTKRLGIVLTRPVGRHRALARALVRRGVAVAVLPGSSIGPAPDPRAARIALIAACDADVVIFVSPTAVTAAYRLAPTLRFERHTRVLAPGPGTQSQLARHGVAADRPQRRHDSEGLLALSALAKVAGRRVVLIGAPGGRELLARALRERGAKIETIHVYTRRPARIDRRHLKSLAALPRARVSIWSSAEALSNLSVGLPTEIFARLKHAPAVASSARLAAALRKFGFRTIVRAASARPKDLIAAAVPTHFGQGARTVNTSGRHPRGRRSTAV